MKKILLSQGYKALIDDEDFERLIKYSWFYNNGVFRSKDRNNFPMSCEVLQTESMIDHKNGNCLDHQKSNLRLCTYSQNSMNRRKRQKKISSKYKGVYPRFRGRWSARIGVKNILGRTIYKSLGCFGSEEQAAKAYDKGARLYFKDFAALNFPEKGERSCL